MATIISGREPEKRVLGLLLKSKKAEFLAVYGRRRVGKTFLIREYFGPVATLLQVTGRHGGSVRDHLTIFAEAMGRTFHGGAAMKPAATWHEAFRLLRSAIEARRGKGKLVIFFDELPWMATRRSGCLEELEFFWNDWCSQRADVILIVCGSAASFILNKFVNGKGGLHNRLTRSMALSPFTLGEVRSYLSDAQITMSERQVAELYMAFGGVPYYLSLVERGESATQAIDRLCFAPQAPLARELNRLFLSLFDNDEKYERIVRALAKRRQGLTRNQLLEELGLTSGGGAQKILTALIEAGFVLESVPFGHSRRDRFYRLIDEFCLFSLAWLAGAQVRSEDTWTKLRGKPRWNTWSGLAFESLCLKHVQAIKRSLGISGVETAVSSWLLTDSSGKGGAQIDLVIDRADDVVSLCEMKFSSEPFVITKNYAEELREKINRFREHTRTRKALQLVLVTAYGVKDNAYANDLVDRTVTLSDLMS